MTADMMKFGRRVFAAVLIIGVVAAIVYSLEIFILVFAGILLGVSLRTAGEWLSAHSRLSINGSMAVVLIAFGGVLFGTLAMFGVQIANQADQLFWAVSQAYSQFHDKLATYHIAGGFNGLNLEAPVRTAAVSVLQVAAYIVLVLFVTLYISINPQMYTELFLSFFRRASRAGVEMLLADIASALRWWLVGQLIAMAVVGVITTIGLLIIGAPMALPLGVLAMLLTFVPYIGAIVSAVPAIVLALTKGSHMVIYVMLVYLVAHVVEGYIVEPMIQRRLVYLPPAMILAMQFLLHLLIGIVGVMFATPLMVVAMVLIKELYFNQDWTESAEDAEAA
jgi:predicted PurR-regulated permease PerM